MPVQQPKTLRRAVLAGAVVLALTGAGGAMVWAAGEPAALQEAAPLVSPQDAATPPASEGPGKSEKSQGQGKSLGRQLRGESVVKKGDGSLETRITQFGTVESVSASSITVKSEDGFTQVYAINAETKIRKKPAAAADGTPNGNSTAPKDSTAPNDDADERGKPSAATAADLQQGDTVRIKGIRNGDTVTATAIRAGAGANGKGLGQGKGLSKGKGLGHGKGLGARPTE